PRLVPLGPRSAIAVAHMFIDYSRRFRREPAPALSAVELSRRDAAGYTGAASSQQTRHLARDDERNAPPRARCGPPATEDEARQMTDDVPTGRPSAVRALGEIGRLLASSRELREGLDLILDHAVALCSASHAMVILVGADERIRIAASRGLESHVRELLPQGGRDGIAMTAITERRSVTSPDVLNDLAIELSQTSRAFFGSEGYRGGQAVPLVADIRVRGALLVARDRVGSFSGDEVELAESLAPLAVVALEQGRRSAVEVRRLRRDEALVEVEREMLAE